MLFFNYTNNQTVLCSVSCNRKIHLYNQVMEYDAVAHGHGHKTRFVV